MNTDPCMDPRCPYNKGMRSGQLHPIHDVAAALGLAFQNPNPDEHKSLPWDGERSPAELTLASACTRCGAPRGTQCIRATHEEQWATAIVCEPGCGKPCLRIGHKSCPHGPGNVNYWASKACRNAKRCLHPASVPR